MDIVREAAVIVLEVEGEAVHHGARLADLEVDSLALVELALIIEERVAARTGTSIRIPDADLEALRTVGDTVDAVLARL